MEHKKFPRAGSDPYFVAVREWADEMSERVASLESERDELRARLEKVESQKPARAARAKKADQEPDVGDGYPSEA